MDPRCLQGIYIGISKKKSEQSVALKLEKMDSIKPTREAMRLNWCFTVNNYTEEDINMFFIIYFQ